MKEYKETNYTGADLPESFRKFCRTEKAWLKKVVTSMGGTNLMLSRGFYFYFGFFTAKNGQVYYFSISDIRHFNDGKMLIRTATHYGDFSGGQNQYAERTSAGVTKFLTQISRNSEN